MNMRTRITRGAIGALAALLVFGAGAFADTSEVPVSVGVVTGQRTLQVTGAEGTTVGGPAVLAFGNTASQAPFGTVVTDLAYERVGYDVYATLSHLYPLSGTSVDCTKEPIPAKAFEVTDLQQLDTTDLDAALESVLSLTDDDIRDDLLDSDGNLLTGLLSEETPVTIAGIPGLVESVTETFSDVPAVLDALDGLTLMSTNPGAGGQFARQDSHPAAGCEGTGDADPVEAYLQTGERNDPDLSGLTGDIFTAAAGDAALTVDEAMEDSLLPLNSKEATSTVYTATYSAVEKALEDAGIDLSLLDLDLDLTTKSVIEDLYATSTNLALSVVAQSGVYPSVQTLTLDRDAMGAPTTGTYHGVMTVTLIDDPPGGP